MSQIQGIITTLKTELRSRHITYADLATKLNMSEANIKNMFSTCRFTLDRIELICEIIELDIVDIIKLFEQSKNRITYLTEEQEKVLVNDIKLLLVADCVRNRYSFQEILNFFNISKPECIHHLATLDHLKLIELLPNNKYKLLISEDFHWLSNGPIEQFFELKLQPEFLKSTFSIRGHFRLFKTVLLSEASQALLTDKIEKLSQEITELHERDCSKPLEKRKSNAILVATRPWVYSAFAELAR